MVPRIKNDSSLYEKSLIDIFTSPYSKIDDLDVYTYMKIYLLNKQLHYKYSDPIRRELVMKTILHSLFTGINTKRIKPMEIIKYKETLNPENYTSYDSFFTDFTNHRIKAVTGITFTEFLSRPIKEMEALVRNSKRINQVTNSVMNGLADMNNLEEAINEFQ